MNMIVAQRTYVHAMKNHHWGNARRIVRMVLHSMVRRLS